MPPRLCLSFTPGAHRRVSRGLVLLNPGCACRYRPRARAYISHYYRRQLLGATPWKKMLPQQFDCEDSAALVSGCCAGAGAYASGLTRAGGADDPTLEPGAAGTAAAGACTPFRRPVLLVLSGDDLTRPGSATACNSRRSNRTLLARRVTRRERPEPITPFRRVA